MTSITQNDLVRVINDIYCDLSPENLTCDGELSRTQVSRRYAHLQRELKAAFKLLGATLDESEAWRMLQNLWPDQDNSWLRLRDIRSNLVNTPVNTTDNSPETAKTLGLPGDVIGKTFHLGNSRNIYTVTGFKTRNFKYPVLAKTQNGKQYKLSVEQVQRGLGFPTTPTPKKRVAAPVSQNAPLAARYGLPEDIVGQTFTVRGTVYTVTGFNTRRPKYPVNCERVRDGQAFKFPPSAIQTALSVAA